MTLIYSLRIYCRDCLNEDPLGCFDGGYEIVTNDRNNEPLCFDDIETAIKGADDMDLASLIEYQVVEKDTQNVKYDSGHKRENEKHEDRTLGIEFMT